MMRSVRPLRLSCLVSLAGLASAGWLVTAAAGQAPGTVRGIVRVAAPTPAGTLRVTADYRTCGETVPDETVIAAPDGALANAVVIVGGLKAPQRTTVPTVTNAQCRFMPHVQVALSGGTLHITNEDDTLHSTHAYADETRTLFNIAFPAMGFALDRPLHARGAVRLECDSHPWMRGYLYLTDELAMTTGTDGRFEFSGVRPGTYELRIWHERLDGASQTVSVATGESAEVTFVLGDE